MLLRSAECHCGFQQIKEVYQLRAKLNVLPRDMWICSCNTSTASSLYDVLDAQRGYFDAQIGVSNAIRDELIAMVNTIRHWGGWQPNDV